MKFTNFKKSLSFKILSLYLIFNALFVLFFGLSISYISSHTLQKEVGNYIQEIIEQVNYQINSSVNDAISKLISASSSASLPGLLNKNSYTVQDALLFDRRLDNVIKKSNIFNSEISDILVLGNNGYVYNINSRADLVPRYPFTETDWYKQAIDISDNVYIHLLPIHETDYYTKYSSFTDVHSFTYSISFALVNANRKPVGTIICNFNLGEIGNTLMSGNYEENGKIALLDHEGRIVSHSDNTGINVFFPLQDKDKGTIYDNVAGSIKTTINKVPYLISYQTTKYGWKIIHYVPIRNLEKHNYPIYFSFLIAFVVCLILNIFAAIFISRSIQRPVQALVTNITNVDYKELTLVTSQYTYNELNQIADKFSILLNELNHLIQQDYLSQIQINKLKFYALRSQINPHFLMNTLQLLQTEIIYGKIESSNKLIISLSKLLRYTLYNYENEVIVKEEINYIVNYLDMFIKKYNGGLTVHYELDPNCDTLFMPKLILQPIVENCIKHGFHNNPHNSNIFISNKISKETLIFMITDDGTGLSEEQLSHVTASLDSEYVNENDIGLSNIHQRIQLKYGKQFGLTLYTNDYQGITILIKLPLLKENTQDETSDS